MERKWMKVGLIIWLASWTSLSLAAQVDKGQSSLLTLASMTINKGDNTWMMFCTALVILMVIPGVALFYGGLVRAKNM
ncbi:MAG: ammonium transporter, partial [Aeromonas sp.]